LQSILILTFVSLFLFCACNNEIQEKEQIQIIKNKFVPPLNQFQSVWDRVTINPLKIYPQETISYSKLFDGAIDLISNNAKRTLKNHFDILEPFDKLAHPNGVCVRGIWEINTSSPYSGYFKNGSKALFIGRASSAMDNTKRGENRAFGMGGKLFPTMDPLEVQSIPSANFFVINDLGGTKAEYYTDVALTNEPDVSVTMSVLGSIAYAIKVANAFSDADSNSGIRQLYEISQLKEDKTIQIITPKWMKIEALKGQSKIGVNDFRDEFILRNNENLVFNISVSSNKIEGIKKWKKIGTITLDASVVSVTCDHGLHFHHPLWRDDLVYQ